MEKIRTLVRSRPRIKGARDKSNEAERSWRNDRRSMKDFIPIGHDFSWNVFAINWKAYSELQIIVSGFYYPRQDWLSDDGGDRIVMSRL